jgi:hypothetical protein
MNKFARPEEEDYQLVVEEVHRMVKHARLPMVSPPVSSDKVVYNIIRA